MNIEKYIVSFNIGVHNSQLVYHSEPNQCFAHCLGSECNFGI